MRRVDEYITAMIKMYLFLVSTAIGISLLSYMEVSIRSIYYWCFLSVWAAIISLFIANVLPKVFRKRSSKE